MWRSGILFLSLTTLNPAALSAAEGRSTGEKPPAVKPATVETKKEPDTHVFVKTLPEGAKVLVDGEDVGSSPRLLVVPPGATKVTIEVELEGFPSRQRTVLVEGGRITRVTFNLEGGARPVAQGEDARKIALRYGRALAEADEATLEKFWNLEDPLDREAASVLMAGLRKAQWASSGPSIRVDLVHHARIGDDGLSACYYVEPGMSPDGSPTPLFQYFELEDGRWRTQPLANLRMMAGMEELEPRQIQRRALARTVIGLCFGPTTPEKLVAAARAQATALEALAAPPYSMPRFERAAESIEKQIAQGEKLAARTWPELQEMAQWYPEAGDVGSPDDFYLAFYLEAQAGEHGREIPRAEGGEPFVAERLPCLTGEEVEKATLEESDSTPGAGVHVKMSDFGSEVLERVTREHKGRKLAMVVEGKVVSAATIREVIGGGQAVITGSFTHAEAEELARQLNSYRERCQEHLDQLRRQLVPDAPERGKSTGR